MPRPKVYPRYRVQSGEEMLLLIDADVLSELDTSWIKSGFALETTVRLFKEYNKAAATWFFVETGIPLYVENTDAGVVWCVSDKRELAQNYRWLTGKARRALAKIVERIGTDGERITEELRRARAE